MNEVSNWIHNHKYIVSITVSSIIFIFGILAMVGAVKNWDWLYEADGHYQNNWSMGQISRYLGRTTARIIGFIAGIFITFAGGYWLFSIY